MMILRLLRALRETTMGWAHIEGGRIPERPDIEMSSPENPTGMGTDGTGTFRLRLQDPFKGHKTVIVTVTEVTER